MTTKEQILGFFVLWAGPERNSLRPFRGMTYRGVFVRGRGDAPRKRGKKASGGNRAEAQNDGGTEAQNDGDTRWRHEVEKRARRHAIRRARRQEAARRGRRAARTREEVKYRKEGRQKRAERTGGITGQRRGGKRVQQEECAARWPQGPRRRKIARRGAPGAALWRQNAIFVPENPSAEGRRTARRRIARP